MHELLPIGHDESVTSYNRGIFLDLVSELAILDSILDKHLRSATVSKTPKNNSKLITGLYVRNIQANIHGGNSKCQLCNNSSR
jgi:hypothetical protein